jgi:hypothetical protein
VDFVEGWDNFLPGEAHGPDPEKPYPVAADLLGPLGNWARRPACGSSVAPFALTGDVA